jgi:hypothetical protein
LITASTTLTGRDTMAIPSAETDSWVSGRTAQEITGLTNYKLMKACALGQVRIHAERGSTPRFNRRDLLTLAGLVAGD